MTVLARLPDVIDREPATVMAASCADDLAEIQRLWAWFEDLVGLRGRKMYAMADVAAGTYATCTPVRSDDDPAAFGLDVGELPGGRFRRGRLRGDPPQVYARIRPGVEELEGAGSVDRTRPLVEFYKRRDEIELWLPLLPAIE
jgi:hypothetical protein